MYVWRFTNIAPEVDWPVEKSLIVSLVDAAAANTLWWFTECGRQDGDNSHAFDLEALVVFEDLTVTRADGTELSIEQFIADARRWWEAFRHSTTAVSVEAQQAASSPSWRRRDPGAAATLTTAIVRATNRST